MRGKQHARACGQRHLSAQGARPGSGSDPEAAPVQVEDDKVFGGACGVRSHDPGLSSATSSWVGDSRQWLVHAGERVHPSRSDARLTGPLVRADS
ncbi:hypothetical protein SAFG77S_13470 [Streptomyces afghaniensis]